MSQHLDLDARADEEGRSFLAQLPAEPLDLANIEEARRRFEALVANLPKPPVPDSVSVETVTAPSADGADIPLRIYRSTGATRPAPAIVWIHGGGMVVGEASMDDPRCCRWADRLGAVVVSVDYRLAPEHPYPTPVEDCYAGLNWVAQSADGLGIDPDRIAIGGASAGGGLAAGTALMARDRSGPALCYQLLVYPMLDDRNQTNSSHAVVDPRVWNREKNQAGWNAYLAGRAGADDVSPYAAPARADNLTGLPPTYIPVGDLDLFLDENVAYAQALLEAGVPTELHVYPGAFHGSNEWVPGSDLSRRWRADQDGALQRALSPT